MFVDKLVQDAGRQQGMVARDDQERRRSADLVARAANSITRSEWLMLDRHRHAVESVRGLRRRDDDEWVCADGTHGLDHPVDKATTEQWLKVFRNRGLHPRSLTGRHHDRSEIVLQGWGARIRTWDRGTKTRCLTTWLRPITCTR